MMNSKMIVDLKKNILIISLSFFVVLVIVFIFFHTPTENFKEDNSVIMEIDKAKVKSNYESSSIEKRYLKKYIDNSQNIERVLNARLSDQNTIEYDFIRKSLFSIHEPSAFDIHSFFKSLRRQGVDIAGFIIYLLEGGWIQPNSNSGLFSGKNTPLLIAISYSPNLKIDYVRRLFKNGCYLEINKSSISLISKIKNTKSVEYLLNHSGYGIENAPDLLLAASRTENGELVNLLLDRDISHASQRKIFKELYKELDEPEKIHERANFITDALTDKISDKDIIEIKNMQFKKQLSLLENLLKFSSVSSEEKSRLLRIKEMYSSEITNFEKIMLYEM